MKLPRFVWLALCLSSASILSGVEVTLEAGSEQAVQHEPFHIQIRVSGLTEVDGEFSFPDPDGFTMRDAGIAQSQSFQIINGQSTRSFHFSKNYILIPQRRGAFLLGPAVFRYRGNSYRTRRLRIEVLSRDAARARRLADPFSERDFFFGGQRRREDPVEISVEPLLDPPVAYVNQEVRFGVDVIASQPRIHDIQVMHETKTGFWEETVDDQRLPEPETVTHDGRTVYRYRRLLSFLYPTAAGAQAVPPVRMRIRYSDGGLRQKTQEIAFPDLVVRGLPSEGMPDGYSGVVGNVRMSLKEAPPDGLRQGVPFPLTLILSGVGNLQTAPAPSPGDVAGTFRILAPATKARSERRDMHLITERLYTYMLYPLAGGKVALPLFQFSFFDPESGLYRVLATESRHMDVAPQDSGSGGTGDGAALAAIEFIAEGEGALFLPLPPLVLVVAGALSLPLLLALSMVRRRLDYLAMHEPARRQSGANRALRTRLAACDRLLAGGDFRHALRELSIVLRGYPLDLLGEGGGTLLHGELAARLAGRGVEPASVAGWQSLLEQVEQGAYSGQAEAEIVRRWRRETASVLSRIAAQLKRPASGLRAGVFLCILLTALPLRLAAAPAAEQATAGEYAGMLAAAEESLASGTPSYRLLFNAGGAALKLGQPGLAVFWYERARLLHDGDSRLELFLGIARGTAGAEQFSAPIHPALQTLFFFHYRLSRAGLVRVLLLIAVVLFVLAGCGIWWHLGKTVWFRIIFGLLLASLLTGSVSLGLRTAALRDPDRAVIIEPGQPLHAAHDPASPVLAHLPAAVEVSIVEDAHGLVKVMLPAGAVGYFPKVALRRINSDASVPVGGP